MRIGFLTPEFVTENYFSGGLAHYLYRVSRSLVSLGHEVHVITLSEIDCADFEYDGIHVHRITREVKGGWFNRLTRNKVRATITCLALSYRFYGKLKRLHRQVPFDIVQYSNYNFCGLFASLLLSVPSMVRISSYSPVWHQKLGAKPTLDARMIELLERLQLRLSRHVYAPSYTLKHMVEEGANITNVEVIRTPCYVETTNLDSSVYDTYLNNKTYLLFFGRFQLHKGFHILAQALPQVLNAHPDCTAVLVGLDLETPLASSMKEYALSLCEKHEERLVFISQIPHTQLYPIIKGARLVVLPSLIDNFPNTCLEAMALAKPVVGTRGASFEELIVEGKTGFLVPAGEVDALADKINEVWIHPRLGEIGQEARRKVQDFSPEHTIQRLLDYSDTVLQGN